MDPAVKRLTGMGQEFSQHENRLRLVVDAVRRQANQITDPVFKELYGLVAGSYEELLDTSMSFQKELIEIIVKEWNTGEDGSTTVTSPDGDEDDLDDGEIIGIESDDAQKILDPLVAFQAMIDGFLPNATDEQKPALEEHRTRCIEAIKLVNELTLPDEEEEEDAAAEVAEG